MKFAKRRCVDVNLDELDRVLTEPAPPLSEIDCHKLKALHMLTPMLGHLRHTERAEGAEVTGTDRGGRRRWRPLFTR